MKKILSTGAGVYIFKNKKGSVLYVGKAANLRSRVASYSSSSIGLKQKRLADEIFSVDTIEVDSEIEALLLEANLIKKYLPVYNVQLKDDKDYIYLKIVSESFPRVLTARKKDLVDAKEFFGPYPSASSLRQTLKVLRRIFPFRTCRINQGRACFYYHLGLCPGVCINAISERDYRKNLRRLKLFLSGRKDQVLLDIEKEMKAASSKLDFEKAETSRREIEAINSVTRRLRRVDEYVEAGSIQELREKELKDLAQAIGIKTPLERIECFDISNFQGSSATGSMVVFTHGSADRGQYRRFKIKDFSAPNDPGMMAEVIRRRLKNSWPLPSLIVVDGGKTQLKAADRELNSAKKQITVVGLAKRNEEIHTLEGRIIRLPRDSQALFLIQRVRDEAHRFAISYYRKLASKNFLTTK